MRNKYKTDQDQSLKNLAILYLKVSYPSFRGVGCGLNTFYIGGYMIIHSL